MGVGFVCAVPAERADDAVELLDAPPPRQPPASARSPTARGVVEVDGVRLQA